MISVSHSHLLVAAQSHPGLSGKNNEDRYAVSAYQLGIRDPRPSIVAIVADGIGGHLSGEVAAEMAVEIIQQTLGQSDGHHPTATLKAAIIRASESIRREAETKPERKGMGATCACAWVIGDRLYTASVGDTRIYLARGDAIQQLTKDHTWVQEAIEKGALTPEMARQHPNLHVIRRYLGSRRTVEPDLRLILDDEETDRESESNQGIRILPDDNLLLCSDGLTDLVGNDEILSALRMNPIEEGVQALTTLANQRGGHDNITLVALRVPPDGAPQRGPRSPNWRALLALGCAGLLFLLVVAALTTLFLGWYFTRPGPEVDPTPLLLGVARLEHLLHAI